MKQLLSPQELAEKWPVSEVTLARWRCEGIGPAFVKLNGRVAYRLEDVQAFEQHGGRLSTSSKLTSTITKGDE
jgi:predicted site-specific integrase-resolvase